MHVTTQIRRAVMHSTHSHPSCMGRSVLKFGYNIRLHQGDYYRQRREKIEVQNGPGGKRERIQKSRKRKLQEVNGSQLLKAVVPSFSVLKM